MPLTWTNSSPADSGRKALALMLSLSMQSKLLIRSQDSKMATRRSIRFMNLTPWTSSRWKLRLQWCSIAPLTPVHQPTPKTRKQSNHLSPSWTWAASRQSFSTSLTCRMVHRRYKNVKVSLQSRRNLIRLCFMRMRDMSIWIPPVRTCKLWSRSELHFLTGILQSMTQVTPMQSSLL